MGKRRARGRDVSGILLLDKPRGISSNAALQQVKHFYFARKAGHTGSLDPLADGLLPICLGNATKLSAFLLDADKRYQVRVRLGITTTTADAEGDVIDERPVEQVSAADVERAAADFRGVIQQLPPMYSALKHKGQRLYKLAREGIEVEREPREVTIHQLDITGFDRPYFDMAVHCSKGTYVRTLAEDIGAALGCGAHVAALRRTGVGPYSDDGLVRMDELEALVANREFAKLDALLLPLDTALTHWPEVRLTADSAYYLRQGQPVLVPKAPTSGWVRLYSEQDGFLGVGEVESDGRIAPRRLLAA